MERGLLPQYVNGSCYSQTKAKRAPLKPGQLNRRIASSDENQKNGNLKSLPYIQLDM
jgi:hypothetical protein